ERLWTERSGILNWALEGCAQWQKLGSLKPPASVINATREYREEEDLIMQFIASECNMEGEIPKGALSSNFKDWMQSQGYKWSPSPRAVTERVKRIPGIHDRTLHGSKIWV